MLALPIFRHLLTCNPSKSPPEARLQGNLLAHLAGGSPLSFKIAPESLKFLEPMGNFFALAGAITSLYGGSPLILTLDLPRDTTLPTEWPWLKILAGEASTTILSDGGLQPSPGSQGEFCRCLPQGNYSLSPQLELLAFLAQHLWGFAQLREGQYQVMARVMTGENALAILPTGAGKSLCFQLPALLLPGISLVVSPLKSLMRDQIASLHRRNILGVDYIDSSRTGAEKRQILRKLRAGELKLLYLSPERLQIAAFQQELLAALELFPASLLAIDEAHCLSEWGHDFRPAYLRLRHFCELVGSPPLAALTATASLQVRRDIIQLLGLAEQDVISPQTLDRPEISLMVKTDSGDRHQAIAQAIKVEIPSLLGKEDINQLHREGTGLVFAPYADPQGSHTRAQGTVAIAQSLQAQGLDCRYYHAQLKDSLRSQVQDEYRDNLFPLLVATKGFGMGIDKEDINYIIHSCAPASLEAYYQEAGRAGRGGQHAHSLIIAMPRQKKCLELQQPGEELPSCHNGRLCTVTGGEKCDYGIQAGLLAKEYPPQAETAARLDRFLEILASRSGGRLSFQYLCPQDEGAKDLKFLYYLQQLGAVADFRVLEYRASGQGGFDLLLEVLLSFREALDNRYRLTSLILRRIAAYKAQKLQMLNTVQIYLTSRDCRRKMLMDYFGDKTAYDKCGFCDAEGIDPGMAGKGMAHRQREQLLAMLDDLSPLADPVPLLELARAQEQQAALRLRAMRILEEQPFHQAALLLAGLLALEEPELAAFGRRNLYSALGEALAEKERFIAWAGLLAREAPEAGAELLDALAPQIAPDYWRDIVPSYTPPARFPHLWLRAAIPLLTQVNQAAAAAAIKGEVV